MLNLAINPALRLYNVMPSPFFFSLMFRCHFVSVLVRWLGGSFAKLSLRVGLSGFANVPPNTLAIQLGNLSSLFVMN